MKYKKGLHIIADISTGESAPLLNGSAFNNMLTDAIRELELNIVGTVLHHFDSGGFTISVCLTESHVCAHTWPEYNMVTLDIYLSNNYKVNDEKGRVILEKCKKHFGVSSIQLQEIHR
jgi:S-adenosylmethionine decarboxylase